MYKNYLKIAWRNIYRNKTYSFLNISGIAIGLGAFWLIALYVAEQNQEKLSLVFTILAFIISCLGLFGLVLFIATQRKKEIGIRKVLGASITSVAVMLSKDFGKLVAIAAIIAIPIAWFAMERWLEGFAYRIDIEWWMFLLSGCIAIVIALITVSFQAIKAAVVNPAVALQNE